MNLIDLTDDEALTLYNTLEMVLRTEHLRMMVPYDDQQDLENVFSKVEREIV